MFTLVTTIEHNYTNIRDNVITGFVLSLSNTVQSAFKGMDFPSISLKAGYFCNNYLYSIKTLRSFSI